MVTDDTISMGHQGAYIEDLVPKRAPMVELIGVNTQDGICQIRTGGIGDTQIFPGVD